MYLKIVAHSLCLIYVPWGCLVKLQHHYISVLNDIFHLFTSRLIQHRFLINTYWSPSTQIHLHEGRYLVGCWLISWPPCCNCLMGCDENRQYEITRQLFNVFSLFRQLLISVAALVGRSELRCFLCVLFAGTCWRISWRDHPVWMVIKAH